MSWQEPSCQQVLVLIIGAEILSPRFELMAQEWLKRNRQSTVIITALKPPLTHSQVFGNGTCPLLEKCNALPWEGSHQQLAESTLSAALLDEKPGVFISYVRSESFKGAEQIHDALIHSGFRVFLDQFNGTPGRVFPHELSEAMASMGLVVLLETSRLFNSRWTRWEAAFARRYRLGPVSLNFNGAPLLRTATERHSILQDPSKKLSTSVVDDIVTFIYKHYLAVAVGRRAYYETLVRLAAISKQGKVTNIGSGVLEISDLSNITKGCALPIAIPGRLRHIHRLVTAFPVGPYLLAGDHQHLSPTDREDLRWLASHTRVTLTGSASVYGAIRNVL